MKKRSIPMVLICLLAVITVSHNSCIKDVGPLPQAPLVSQTLCDSLDVKFSTDINPIIQLQCVNTGCHAAGGGSTGVDLSTYALLDTARIRARVLDGDPSYMPQGGALPLSDRQKIDCWLKAGAPNN